MNVQQLRDNLPVTRDMVYMNTGWSGPMPTRVLNRVRDTLEQEANGGPASQKGLAVTRSLQDEARSALGALLNVDADDLLLTHSTREGLDIVVYGIDWQPGDELLICDLEHPALTSPSDVLAERRGVVVKNPNISYTAQQAEILEIIAASITPNTKLVALSHIQYTCGLRMPIKEIAGIAHEMGVPLAVDGAQSIGHIEVDLSDLGADYYALPGQKWLLGPNGTGALYVNPERRDGLEPLFSTNQIESQRALERSPLARFNLVTHNPGLVAGLSESARLASEIGIRNIEERAMLLADLLRRESASIPGCTLLSPTSHESACGLVTVSLEGWPPADLTTALQERLSVVGRTVHDPDGIRFSAHYFNTEEEVERAVEALKQLSAEGYTAP